MFNSGNRLEALDATHILWFYASDLTLHQKKPAGSVQSVCVLPSPSSSQPFLPGTWPFLSECQTPLQTYLEKTNSIVYSGFQLYLQTTVEHHLQNKTTIRHLHRNCLWKSFLNPNHVTIADLCMWSHLSSSQLKSWHLNSHVYLREQIKDNY